MIRMLQFSLTLTLLLTISGCSIRPIDNAKYVVVEPGDPIQALDSADGKTNRVIVKGVTLKGGAVSTQDVTGWVMMPPSHWKIVSAQLEKDKAAGTLGK